MFIYLTGRYCLKMAGNGLSRLEAGEGAANVFIL